MTQSIDAAPIVFKNKVLFATMTALVTGVPVLVHQGGAYSGKTYNILVSLHQYLSQEVRDRRMIVSVVACTFPHLRRGALRDFIDICGHLGGLDTYNKGESTFQIGASTVEFFSADNDGKVRGSKRDLLFINEANLINFERYRQLAMRTRQTVIIDYNPVAEFWCHEHIIPRPDTVFKRTTYLDNPVVPDKVKQDIERLKDVDEQLYRVYALGLTGQASGVIYTNVELVDEFPDEAKKVCLGLDFGFSADPCALVLFGELHGEIYAEELLYETGLTNQDLSRRLRELGVSRNIEIFADSAEPKSIEEIRREGWNIRPAIKGADSVRHGIQLLRERKINITKSSLNLDKERRNYTWKTSPDGNPLPVPVDAFNHALDALRYAASAKLTKGFLRLAR